MFVINTDMGFMSGQLHKSVKFVATEEEARQFTSEQIKAFGDGIVADLHDWYKCEWIHLEQV